MGKFSLMQLGFWSTFSTEAITEKLEAMVQILKKKPTDSGIAFSSQLIRVNRLDSKSVLNWRFLRN